MRLRDAAKWIKEKITGKKTEETPVLTPMIATEEDIEKAKEMDREIEEMEKKSALMAPIVTSQAEMERLQRFEADSKQIAEMAGKPHEEVAEAILKVTTETPASLEEATQEIMRLFHELHDQGNTIVLITHDEGVALQAERRIAIFDGHVREVME